MSDFDKKLVHLGESPTQLGLFLFPFRIRLEVVFCCAEVEGFKKILLLVGINPLKFLRRLENEGWVVLVWAVGGGW